MNKSYKNIELTKNSDYLNNLFILAVKDNSLTDCKNLINHIDINFIHKFLGTPLMIAICYKNFEIFKYLLNNGADPNILNYNGISPLYYAAYSNQFEFCEYLLQNFKVDLNIQACNGFTPIHHAVINKNVKMIDLFLNNGADYNIPDKKGFKPLQYSKGITRYSIIEFQNKIHPLPLKN